MPNEKVEYVILTESGRATMVWDIHSLAQAKKHAERVGKPLYKRTTTITDEVVA